MTSTLNPPDLSPQTGAPDPPEAPPPRRRSGIGWTIARAASCLIISLAIAAIAYAVGKALPPTYQAYGLIRVALPSQQGIQDPSVTAANDLASQYAQLASSEPVVALTARALGVSASEVRGKISGSTVAAQNLVQVTYTGESANTTTSRAAAATVAFQRYLTKINQQGNTQYVANATTGLRLFNRTVARLTAQLRGAPPAERSSVALLLASLTGQRAQLVGQVARDAAGNQPLFQVVEATTPSTQTIPKPPLYALVAFVVALIITGQAAFALSRRTRI